MNLSIVILILYALALLIFGVWRFICQKKISLENYLVYERKANSFQVAMSLTALVFGASSVFGLAGWATQFSWNAIWWTLSGVIFLIILSFTLVSTVWETKGYTIVDIIASVFGEKMRFFVSLTLFIAWLMVLAGQIIAGANLIHMLIGDFRFSGLIFVLIFGVYSLLIGQEGAIKTGFLQTLLMIIGLGVLLALVFYSGKLAPSDYTFQLYFDEKFSFGYFLSIFIPVGLSYLFGPDIYSRIFSAKDIPSARKGILIASFLILLVSIMIVMIGISAKVILGSLPNKDNAIPQLFRFFVSDYSLLQAILIVSLVSIPLSGADVMVISLSTLLAKDILLPIQNYFKKQSLSLPSLFTLRVVLIFVAFLSLWISFSFQSIISALLLAYKIFASVLVPLLFISLLIIRYKRTIQEKNRIFLGIYLFLAALSVVFIEMKIITLSIPYYSLWFLIFNFVVQFLFFIFLSKKKT